MKKSYSNSYCYSDCVLQSISIWYLCFVILENEFLSKVEISFLKKFPPADADLTSAARKSPVEKFMSDLARMRVALDARRQYEETGDQSHLERSNNAIGRTKNGNLKRSWFVDDGAGGVILAPRYGQDFVRLNGTDKLNWQVKSAKDAIAILDSIEQSCVKGEMDSLLNGMSATVASRLAKGKTRNSQKAAAA